MNASANASPVDIVMLGSFSLWTRGTLQSRALPLARELASSAGLRFAFVTTPWDAPEQAGNSEIVDGIPIYNTSAILQSQVASVARQQLALLKQLRPALVHIFKPKAAAGLTADLLFRLGSGAPIIVDHDDWEGDGGWNDRAGYSALARRMFAYQERRIVRVSAAVTAASTLLETWARRLRSADELANVTFLPNGLSPDWLTALRRGHATPTERRLVLYSRFAEFSSEWLVSTLQQIDYRLGSHVQLDIVGDAPADLLGTANLTWLRPTCHGYVDRAQLPRLLGSASVALYPYDDNLINRSKQSVKLLELMASGCAIVASDVGDIRRIAGDTVVTPTTGKAGDFAAQTIELLENPERAAALGQAAGKRVEHFSTTALARRLLPVYERAGLR